MKKLLVFALTLVMGLSMVACGTKTVTEPDVKVDVPSTNDPSDEVKPVANDDNPLSGLNIGNSICYKGDEWCARLSDQFESIGATYGIKTTVEDGDLNVETQNKQIENMISAGVDAIFVDPNTPTGVNEALIKAKAAGIPIFAYDGFLEDFDAETTITWDQVETGELMAEYVIDYVNKNLGGNAKVVLLSLAASPACVMRGDAFKAVCAEKAPGINIFNTQDSDGNREKSANAISNIVEPFDLVVSVVDNGAWGAISAIEARGLTNVKVFSMGGYGPEPFEALKANHPNYQACVVISPDEVAKLTYEAAVRYFKGEKLEATTNIKLYVADSKNVTDFWDFN